MAQSHPEPQSSQQIARSPLDEESLLGSRRLREFLGGCSEMHIWRLLNDDKNQALAFPKPMKINGRNYWRLGALRQWVRERQVQSQATSMIALPAALRSKTTPLPCNSRKRIRPSKRARRNIVRCKP